MGASLPVHAEDEAVWEAPDHRCEVVIQTRADARMILSE
jgi:hypothetical protein